MEGPKENPDIARAEAKIIKEMAAPAIERMLKTNTPPEVADQFSEVAHLEFGSQLLEKIQRDNPGYYAAQVSRILSFERLVDAIVPAYLDFGGEPVSPERRSVKAQTAPPEQLKQALESAEQRARVAVERTVQAIRDGESKAKGMLSTTRRFNAATEFLAREMEDGHLLTSRGHGNNPADVSALLECALSTIDVEDYGAKMNLTDQSYDMQLALKKQLGFTSASEPKDK